MFFSFATHGEVNPRLPVARRLLEQGHDVSWVFAQRDSPFWWPDLDSCTLGSAPLTPVLSGEHRSSLGRRRTDEFRRMFYVGEAPYLIEEIRGLIAERRPDVIAVDPAIYAGPIAATVEGVPFVSMSANLSLAVPPDLDYPHREFVAQLAEERQALFARYGIAVSDADFRDLEYVSPVLNTMFTTRALLGSDVDLPPNTALIGPSVRAVEDVSLDGLLGEDTARPMVYVSFGTRQSWQPRLVERVAEAATPLGVHLVISSGDRESNGVYTQRLAGDVVVTSFAPQLALLQHAAVMVTQGGGNGIMEAMHYGVPVVVIPLYMDTPIQAHYVRRSGVGVALDGDDATVDQISEALRQALADPSPIRRSMARVHDSYRSLDGAQEAARLLAALASGGGR